MLLRSDRLPGVPAGDAAPYPPGVQPTLPAGLQRALALQHSGRAADRPWSIVALNGLTGESLRLQRGECRLLARIDREDKRQLGTDRAREYRVLRRLRASGLAPRPRVWHRQGLLLEWLEGNPCTDAQWHELLAGGALARRVRQLHRQPLYGFGLDLRRRLAGWWSAISPHRRGPRLLKLHQHFMRAAMPCGQQPAPLHMDLHAGNVLLSPRPQPVLFIDWEYAGDGDIALELATLFAGNQLNEEQQRQFLRAYLPHAARTEELRLQQRIRAWLPWVEYMMLMWYELRWQQSGELEFIRLAGPLRARFGVEYGRSDVT